MDELRDYEVIFSVRIITVSISGGTTQAEEAAKRMIINDSNKHYCRVKAISISDLGVSEPTNQGEKGKC